MNKCKDVVKALGSKTIAKIIDLADVYHSDNIDKVAEDFIQSSGIKNGNFDNVKKCEYSMPTYWDIGKVYKRLVIKIMQTENLNAAAAVIKVYNSFVSEKIDNYNSNFYYDTPEYIFQCYLQGKVLE